jgi:excisionase family DNA binding protein
MEIHEIDVCADNPLLTAEAAAEYLSVSKTTLNKIVRVGRVPFVQMIADRRFRRSDLNRLAAESLTAEGQEKE